MIKTMLPNAIHQQLDSARHSPLVDVRQRRSMTPDMPMIKGLGGDMTAILKKLCADDAEAYQALRLEGLLNHPCEFGTAYEEEAGLSLDEVGHKLDAGFIFGAFIHGELLAIAGYRHSHQKKKQHKGELFGVYVGKKGRRQGLGEAVVRHVIRMATGDVEQLIATVASLNLPAKSLYRKLGFVAFGHEPRAHKVNDRYFDQDLMVLMLV